MVARAADWAVKEKPFFWSYISLVYGVLLFFWVFLNDLTSAQILEVILNILFYLFSFCMYRYIFKV